MVELQVGDVGADGDVAAILGPSLADLEPTAVGELGLESAGGGAGRFDVAQLAPDRRQGAPPHDFVVAPPGGSVLGAERVKVAELRIAKDELVARVPQNERLGDCLDRVAQAHVGGGVRFRELALFGHVDGDPDEMAAAIGGIWHDLGTGAQPDPGPVGAANAELVVDGGLAGSEVAGEAVEVAVIRVDQGIDVAEGQELALAGITEQGIHRIRPVDPPSRNVPVPEPATPTAKSGVEAFLDLFADAVAGMGTARLEAVGEPDPDDDDGRRGQQGGLDLRTAAPGSGHVGQGLDHRDLAAAGGKVLDRGDGRLAVGQGQHHGACTLTENAERLRLAEIGGERAERPCRGRMSGGDLIVRSHDENLASGVEKTGR